MLLVPHWSSAGMFCSSAATSEPTALASLVLTFSHAAVSKPAWLRPAPVSVTDAELETCQFGARSVVSPIATGVRIAQTHPAVTAAVMAARARNRDPGTEFLSWIVRATQPRGSSSTLGHDLFVAFPNESASYTF